MKYILVIFLLINVNLVFGNVEENRVALVIGNSDYLKMPYLNNAQNDAVDIKAKLENLGFEVINGLNITRREMNSKISEFDKLIDSKNENVVAVFFYAGHGLEVKKTNYLVPVDAEMQYQEDAEYDGVSLDKIVSRMERSNSRLNLIILDACRNNPLPSKTRSGGATWAKTITPLGTFIAYGTAPGQKALDAVPQTTGELENRNGLFTKYLLEYMDQPGYTVEQVFKSVRTEVRSKSNNLQIPWTTGNIEGDFYFKPGDSQSLAVIIEKRPKWLIPVLAGGALLLLGFAGMQYKQRQQIAWAKSVILSKELKKDNEIIEEELHKSQLVRDEIVGYLKDLNNNKFISLISSEDIFSIGRDAQSDHTIDDNIISGRHCRIGYDATKKTFWIEDLDSSNGIWFNKNHQLKANTKQPLKDGQVFYLANEDHPMVLVKINK